MHVPVLYETANLFTNKRHEKKKINNLVCCRTSNVSRRFKMMEVLLVLHVNMPDNSFLNS